MSTELIILILMLATFAVSVFFLKMPAGVALIISALAGALAAGEGVPVRHLVEGGFGFLEAILIIATAMVFMKTMEASGVLARINLWIIRTFHRKPTLLMLVIVLFVMFPGTLTGLSSTCVLTTGVLVAPVLLAIGIPRLAAGSLIAMAAVFGEVAPPISIPVMIIGGGVDMPYIGFTLPLLLVALPPAIFTALYFRFRFVGKIDLDAVLHELEGYEKGRGGFRVYIPLIFVIAYMIGEIVLHEYLPHLGVPLIFTLGAIMGVLLSPGIPVIRVSREALRMALPVIVILVGVGMFLQILTLTGVRGYLAVLALKLPDAIKYLAAALMPFMGSAYASASVIGVPLVYVFIGKSSIVVTASLVMTASLGDLMPPPSLLCAYAAQTTGIKNHYRILKESVLPIAIALATALAVLIFAEQIASFIF
jgi:TRAP-type C4-dicarboxylate transport system permease large subunit